LLGAAFYVHSFSTMGSIEKGSENEHPEFISDADMIYEADLATVDRVARHPGERDTRGAHEDGESWGFRIRHLFDSLKR
jgi:hypothetical protein